MKQTKNKFEHVTHPFIFVLKEGNTIQHNFLDYSLLLLKVGQPDIIPSPNSPKSSNPFIHVLKK